MTNHMTRYINGPAADGWMVERMTNHLIKAFEEFLSNEPDNSVDYLDAFMAVHNFHVRIVLDIESRSDAGNALRKAAVDTFKEAMETKPPLSKDQT